MFEEYTLDTKDISSGTYKAIVKAIDNQDPALMGQGISASITITGDEFEMPDDSVFLPEPQIINVSPTGEDTLSNTLATIRASLLASDNAKIVEESINIKLDGVDVTSLVKFNKISESEYTLIYQTEKEFEVGLHKVEISFEDSEDLEANKSWTFTIEGENQDPDKFYIFGYGISKTIVYVVTGGVLLLLLALVVPLILVKVWKDDENTSEKDDVLLPPVQTNTVEKIVNKPENFNTPNNTEVFTKLETPPTMPDLRTTPEPYLDTVTTQEETTTDIDDEVKAKTEEDLKVLYEKIQQEENTPPEPVL